MTKCKCPKGYPVDCWERVGLYRPQLSARRLKMLFRKHTGRCLMTDKLLEVCHD